MLWSMVDSDRSPVEGEKTAFISALEAGVVIDDLELVRKLGEGAQGQVWEANQKSFGRSVAVKLLPTSSAQSEAQIERFKREAEAAGRLNHPNIVATHAFEEWRGQHLIIQELVTGGDLEDEIERRNKAGGTRTDDHQHWTARTCRLLAQALHFAHQNGVVHRDIKPGNVLLSADGSPKITDFGLAKVEDDRGISRTGVAVGTPYYMSPEQVRAERGGIDHRTDVYSLGAVLYRMLTGHVPFTGKTRQGLLLDILTRDPQPIRKLTPDIDRDLEAVCLKCLEKEPGDRYASAQALSDDLQRWEEGLGTSARPASMVSIPFRRMRRQATSGLLLMAALVPVAFLALDLGMLQGAAEGDAELHWARQAGLAVAALMFMWPMAVLSRRLAGGRGWARIPAVVLTLLAATLSARAIETQRLDQLQGQSRERFMTAAGAEYTNVIVPLIDQHVIDWEHRFGRDDYVAVSYAYICAGRYPDASQWALKTVDLGSDSPVVYTLQYAIYSFLGQDDNAVTAEQLMFEGLRGDALEWRQLVMIGNILQKLGRYDLAEESFLRAGQDRQADRNAMDFALAQLHAVTCRFDEAQSDIDAVLRWQGDEVGPIHWAHRIAVGRRDWDAAERHLDSIAKWPHWHFLLNHNYLETRGLRDQARDFALETAETHGDDPWMVSAAASKLFSSGWLDEAKRQYERLELLDERATDARVGLSAILVMRGELDLARGHARRAYELDPNHEENLYNLSQIEIVNNVLTHGPDDSKWPVEALERWLEATEACLAVNGRMLLSLNNAAYARGRIFTLSGERAQMDEALTIIQRAIRLGEAKPGSSCEPVSRTRISRSRSYDTLASLHEWEGDLPKAVDAARLAFEALAEEDEKYQLRERNLERLQGLVTQG
jgi:tetratricopeptide (TPR) repeat protein